jgi:DNA-binding transcriptional LysR family regulator
MNPYELEQLAAFAELGTLAAVAEKMNISQPTITRSMQHLEEEFDVPLFSRKSNRIELTETGKKAVEHARIILSDIRTAQTAVKEYYLSTRTIRVASCVPTSASGMIFAVPKCLIPNSLFRPTATHLRN